MGLGRQPTPQVHSPQPQILITLHGCFLWHVGAARHFVDTNRCVIIHAGEASQDSHPTDSGDVEALLISPDRQVLEDLLRWDGYATQDSGELRAHTLFASPALQLATHAFVTVARDPLRRDSLLIEETLLTLLRRLARPHAAWRAGSSHRGRVSHRVHRMVRTVKERLQAVDRRASLSEIARGVNVTAAHLTDVFRRIEGVPLADYHRRIRLARALHELPGARDLATLALDLGFSSHGHFSAAFKALYGITPSQFRDGRLSKSAG